MEKIEKENLEELCMLLMDGKVSFEHLLHRKDFLDLRDDFLQTLEKLYSSTFLKYASKELKINKQFILFVCEIYPVNFDYISEELKSDKEFILELCRCNDSIFRYIGEKFKNDKDVVLVACRRSWYNFLFVSGSENLTNDREFIKKMVDINPLIIMYTKYKDDKEIALKAVSKNGNVLFYLSDRLKEDDDILLKALQKSSNAKVFTRLPLKIRTQKKFFMMALNNSYNEYYLPEYKDLLKDKDVVNAILSNNKLVKLLYKKYYKNYADKLKETNKYNIYDFVKYCLTNKDIIFNLYYPNGIDEDLKGEIISLLFFYGKDVENRFDTLKREVVVVCRNANVKIYNDIVKNKNDEKKLIYILNKNGLNQNNIYDFIINNVYLDKQMKEALYTIIETYYGKVITVSDIIDLINNMLDNELSLEEMFRDNVVLKEKVISKKLFYRLYNDTIESNPFLHDYIKNALDKNKRRGFKKILKLGNTILARKFNSLDEYNVIFSKYSPTKVLILLSGTDLYPRLLDKFKHIDGIELDEEFNNYNLKVERNK